MKKILGLDLGTSSIGWALVNEAENETEKSSIIKLGVRVNPLTTDELSDFEKGKTITTTAERTLKRGMRRNLQRYKLRRANLIEILKKNKFISDETILSESGNYSTFETYRLRAKAVEEEITLEEFSRILLMINKKRGYKSSRKAKNQDEGQLIDGMSIARRLYEENLTPGQFCLQLLQAGKKYLPDFYRSDLQNEFDRIWNFQKSYYPEILTEDLKEQLINKNEKSTWAICEKPMKLVGIKRGVTGSALRLENFKWRANALSSKMELEQLVIVFQKINGQINSSSGYLGSISDRSKILYFKKQTVGQFLMAQLDADPNISLRNQVFYRQDYLDEFNILWEKQAQFHSELTDELKREIRDIVIFYQRRLKSQKGLISFCEFENRQIEIETEGKKRVITIGSTVVPRSSPVFQEFRIWQNLNNLEVFPKGRSTRRQTSAGIISAQIKGGERRLLDQEEKDLLFRELSVREELKKVEVLKLLFENHNELDLNYSKLDGNKTVATLYNAFNDIIHSSGHEKLDFKKLRADEIVSSVQSVLMTLGCNPDIFYFDPDIDLDKQLIYRLWHLIYSYEGDNSNTGIDSLTTKISDLCGLEKEYAGFLSKISFQNDYGNLSAKAIRKILPYLKTGNRYDLACKYAGYRHSKSSLTGEEIAKKVLKDKLEILPKNSLRNPVVEKILNQMVNVVNAIIDKYGRPDEIRIELARELKKNAAERDEMSRMINEATRAHTEIRNILRNEYSLAHISRNDVIRYKLYEELKTNGYKTLYSNTYIPREKLFGKEFDIEHIIPQARLFDDSFSNKTLEKRDINLEKGDRTAIDFVRDKYGETGLQEYVTRITSLYKNNGIGISKAKYNKLKLSEADIPDGFIERDLRNTQYIARKAMAMLNEVVRTVIPTTGSITDQLREDWQLVDVMKELNWNKYKALGLVEYFEDRHGRQIGRIKDWTKRSDHRHHAMDALTVAFTKKVYIQYFNNVNARYDKSSEAYTIERKYFSDRKVKPPIPLVEFRAEAKKHLEALLVSIKAKNKVITKNINVSKKRSGVNRKVQQTPRGQLHRETIYGRIQIPVIKEVRVGSSMNEDLISKVTVPKYRTALYKRLENYNFDPRKAFTGKNSLKNQPLYLDQEKTKHVPEKVRILSFEYVYTIRKEVASDLNVAKVIDHRIRRILQERIKEYGDAKKAFSNLDENPIWLNEQKGISIKRVTISGISNAQALHEKRDKEGCLITDTNGKNIPVDFVNTGNNHHVAIYRDANGQLQENVVSFFEAVTRANLGLPVVDKEYRKADGWEFLFTMKQNEYFVFPNSEAGFNPNEINLFDSRNYPLISPNLFRVQKLSTKNYVFNHHLETTAVSGDTLKNKKQLSGITYRFIQSLPHLEGMVKIRINHIGLIVSVGEY